MKNRHSNIEIVTAQNGNGCCAPTTSPNESAINNNDCCEQPADDSPCCDKNETKIINVQKTGCC